jgi:hypothetical protein
MFGAVSWWTLLVASPQQKYGRETDRSMTPLNASYAAIQRVNVSKEARYRRYSMEALTQN